MTGKMNYEREKARRDMGDEIRRASVIRQDRERDMHLIFAGTMVAMAARTISGKTEESIADTAKTVRDGLDAAKALAQESNPDP